MPNTIFFSWQVDTPALGGRNLIERALDRAAARIGSETSVEEAVRGEITVDRDTRGVAGSPPIVDTIFNKIDHAAVFVPDLTFVGKRRDDRPTPNPNVLIEYGWALKSIKHSRIVPVMNTAFGEPTPSSMPFDLRHLRNPITYNCPNDLDEAARREVRERLAKELEAAILLVLKSEAFKDSLPKPVEPAKFLERKASDGRGRFKPVEEPIGVATNFGQDPREVILSGAPACWFRLWPELDQAKTWTVSEIATAMSAQPIIPCFGNYSSCSFVRGSDGYGTFAVAGAQQDRALSVVFGFTNGEIWAVDAFLLQACRNDRGDKVVPPVEDQFREALSKCVEFLHRLKISPPFKWNAGMEDLKGRLLYVPTRPGYVRLSNSASGRCLEDVVSASGIYSDGQPAGTTLRPFFTKLYDACGTARQDWQDQ